MFELGSTCVMYGRWFFILIAAALVSQAACKTTETAEGGQTTPPAQVPAQPSPLSEAAKNAVLLEGLGQYQRKVSTSSPEAQAFFDQAIMMYWGFNHEEAFRAFAKAAE